MVDCGTPFTSFNTSLCMYNNMGKDCLASFRELGFIFLILHWI